jgi:hypothetical protein
MIRSDIRATSVAMRHRDPSPRRLQTTRRVRISAALTLMLKSVLKKVLRG